ncbi:MAG: hypothetical protein ACI4F9_06685, partial [Lachnospiraceae bacterium]
MKGKKKMSGEENKKQKFDPYTGNPITEEVNENIDERQEETYQYGYNSTEEHLPNIRENYAEKSNGLTTVCLVLGILSILSSISCCFTIFSIPLAIASIICGCLAGKPENTRDKKRFVGILMSIISIVLTVCMVIFLAIMVGTINFENFEYHFDDGDM